MTEKTGKIWEESFPRVPTVMTTELLLHECSWGNRGQGRGDHGEEPGEKLYQPVLNINTCPEKRLSWYRAAGYGVFPLTLVYGQKHGREIRSAAAVCESLGLSPRVVDISSARSLFGASALTDADVSIPRVSASEENYETLAITVVPNRNAVFLSLAVAYSQSVGCDAVFYGAHHSDRGVYPDCRREFVSAFEAAERLATDNEKLVIDAPFAEMDKSEIVALGSRLGVPFERTWSCYAGSGIHCGSCSSCRERKRAFAEAKVADPTEYET